MSKKSDEITGSLPSAKEVLASTKVVPEIISQNEQKFVELSSVYSLTAETEYTKLSGLKDHFTHKKLWSFFLMGLMTVMLVFQMCLLAKVGTNHWDFKEYVWLLPALLVQNLGQIIALAYVVVKSLFR